MLRGVDGAVLGEHSFLLRYFGERDDDRLADGESRRLPSRSIPAPEPLLAPPFGFEWETIWTSDHERYGGPGVMKPVSDEGWSLPAEATIALRACPETRPRRKAERKACQQSQSSSPVVIRSMAWDPAPSLPRGPAQSRMARDQRPRRLRVRHRLRRDHPEISWHPGGGAAGAARPRGDVESRLGVSRVSMTDEVVSLGAEERAGGPARFEGRGVFARIPARGRHAGLDLSRARSRDREAHLDAAPPKHRPRQLPDHRRGKTAAARTAARFSFPAPRGRGRSAAGRALQTERGRRPLRNRVRSRENFRRLRMRLCGHATAFTIAPAKIHQVVYRTEQARGYAHEGELWSPGIFPGRSRRTKRPRP